MSVDAEGLPHGGWEGVASRYILWLRSEQQQEFNAAAGKPYEQDLISRAYSARIRDMRRRVREAKAEGRSLDFYIG